ncbi:MAG: type IV pilus twitching motility protein PilT [Candidatus Omnitrophica bacterium]|nr:type IV pilus twitching motility protein PilT [Candidatus Omnitrophota bacterium]MBU4457174.1 type IV pilus twitching motility protein PilT [Candidatus Omnitrophota bacterium]
MPIDLNQLLKDMVKKGASDLHIGVNARPHFRVDERLMDASSEVMNERSSKDIVYSILTNEQKARFEREKELDFAFSREGLGRFRVNVFWQRGYVGAAIRALPIKIMNFEECGLPVKVMEGFCKKSKGLVLVTGATGSGKSTTLASMVDWINTRKDCHIITIEDPMEYVHSNKKSIIDQREVGSDTLTFPNALKHILREDPDVILIGEMRDLETVESALVIAETGHLVLATLHTSDAVQTINRVIDVFPARQQQQVRTQLSFVLMGVLSQQLIPRVSGDGRALAVEVLVANHAIRSQIREEKVHQIFSSIQTGQKEGMQTMNQSLYSLYLQEKIKKEDALLRTTEPQDMERIMGEKK